MKAHLYIISTGVIAFGILGGNLTFNILQCKQWNSTNVTNNVVDRVCLREWCNATCHTSSVLVTASPWIILAVVCACVTLYYLMLPHQPVDDSVYDIGVSLSALSLEWHNDHSNNNHSNTSWFSELNKLDLLTADHDSSLPVAMDITSKQIISPPKLKFHPTCSCKTNQWNRTSEDNHCVDNKQHYIITTLSCLLFLSVTCNVVLIYWIT